MGLKSESVSHKKQGLSVHGRVSHGRRKRGKERYTPDEEKYKEKHTHTAIPQWPGAYTYYIDITVTVIQKDF